MFVQGLANKVAYLNQEALPTLSRESFGMRAFLRY